MRTATLGIIAVSLLATTAAASGPAGKLICQMEVKQVEQLFAQKRASIPLLEIRTIEDRLALAHTYCAAYNYPASVTMAGIKELRARLQRSGDANR